MKKKTELWLFAVLLVAALAAICVPSSLFRLADVAMAAEEVKGSSDSDASTPTDSSSPTDSTPEHKHTLTAVAAKAATATTDGNTAYWKCSVCNKLFSDAEGKTETTIDKVTLKATGSSQTTTPATTPTTETTTPSTGTADNTAVATTYKITYNLDGGTNNKNNPDTFTGEKEITLKDPSKKGYAFKGWFTNKKYTKQLKAIKEGTAKNITLYAKWEKISVKKATISSAKNVKGKKLEVKFKKAKGADGYVITYSTTKKFTKKTTKTVTVTKTTATIKKLKKGSTYYVKVQAYKLDSAGKKVLGKASAVKKVKIKK